jgi:hypothetical protein
MIWSRIMIGYHLKGYNGCCVEKRAQRAGEIQIQVIGQEAVVII